MFLGLRLQIEQFWGFPGQTDQCSAFHFCANLWRSWTIGFSFGLSVSLTLTVVALAFASNLGPGLALFAFLAIAFAWYGVVRTVSLKKVSTALETTVSCSQ